MNKFLIILISLIFIVGCSKDESSTPTPPAVVANISLEIKTLMAPYYSASLNSSFFNESLSKTYVDFGQTNKNKTVTKIIKIQNNPLLAGFQSNLSIIESEPKVFSISENSCSTIASGASCSFSLTATVPSVFYSGTKFAHIILGKDDKGQEISVDVYTEIAGDILESYLTTTQGFSVQMPKNFSDTYSQDLPQERFITVTNNSPTRYLRNSFSSSSFVGSNASDFVIKTNNCNYPIPPNRSCQISVLYKTWKNNANIPDVEMKLPNLDQKLSLQTGNLNTYTGTYSAWSVCSAAAICAGQGTRTQTLQTCIKNGTDSVDLSNCTSEIVEGCFSPAGNRTISVSNGSLTQSCQANSTSWENQSITCSAGYHNFNFECVPDIYIATYSEYAANTVTAVCSGTQKAYRDVLTCTRLHDGQVSATTLCNDVDPFIFYYSPEGTRNVPITNGSRAEKCVQGANTWTTTNVSCSLNFHQSGSNCVADTYLPIEFSPYDENLVTAACSGTQEAHRSITKCVKTHNYEAVSTSLCVDPNPIAIYQSPFSTDLLTYSWGLQFLKCEAGAMVWDVSNVSCAQYHSINPANTKECIANSVSDPIASIQEDAGKNNPLEFTVIGDNNTNKVDIFSENTCSNKIGSAVKGQGIWDVSLSLNLNTINPIFVQSSNTITSQKSSCVFVKNYRHDNTSPTGSISIESNAIRSTKKTLTLTTVATDIGTTVKAMKISENSSCQSGTYVPYTTLTEVDPSLKKGEVYYSVKFLDEVDNESPCYSARIIYELIPSMVSTAASNWNEYFQRSSPADLCTGNEVGTDAVNAPCVHGGEKRKIILDQTSCLNLTMSDSMSMFSWACAEEGGRATFTSSLAVGARLLTLIDQTNENDLKWKKISVTLKDMGVEIVQSEDFTWLSNPIIKITPAANTVSLLADSGVIYVVKDVVNSGGFAITADQVGLVNLDGSYSTFSNTSANCDYNNNGTVEAGEKCGIFSKDKKFLYVEGAHIGDPSVSHGLVFNGSKYVFVNYFSVLNGKTGLNLNSTTFNKIIRFNGSNLSTEPIRLTSTSNSVFYFGSAANSSTSSNLYLTSSNNNVFSHMKMGNSLLDGIQLVASSNNKFSQISVSSSQRKGINIDSTSSSNIFNDMIVTGNTAGIENAGSLSIFASINIVNNASTALNILNTSKQNLVSNMMMLNNRGSGVRVDTSLYNVFGNMYILNQETLSGNAGIFYNGSTLYNKIIGSLLIPSSSSIPCISASNANGINNSCVPQFYSGFSFSNSVMPLTGIFKTGSATSNLYDVSVFGSAYTNNTQYLSGIIKSLDFSNNANAGFCGFVGGICYILDFSLMSSDQTLLKMLPPIVPAPPTIPTPSNEFFVDGSSCPISVSGTESFDDGICVSATSPYGVYPSITVKSNCVASGQQWASVQKSTIGVSTPVAAINYLKNAREITDPYNPFYGSGNHNGLCESGESCIYTPNVGAYQGYGELKSCQYNNNGGLVTGVKMYGYETNGE